MSLFYFPLFMWVSYLDWTKRIIPDSGVLLCLGFGIFMEGGSLKRALMVWVLLSALYLLGAKRHVGFGDVKLFSAMASCLRFEHLLHVLWIACIIAAFLGLMFHKKRGESMAFAPYLCIAFLLVRML